MLGFLLSEKKNLKKALFLNISPKKQEVTKSLSKDQVVALPSTLIFQCRIMCQNFNKEEPKFAIYYTYTYVQHRIQFR